MAILRPSVTFSMTQTVTGSGGFESEEIEWLYKKKTKTSK